MSALRAVGTPIPATPPLHGLQASADEVRDPDRWDLGATFCPENCVEVGVWDPDCAVWPGGIPPTKSPAPANQPCYDVDPFVIESSFECSTAGFKSQDYRGRARRQLEAGTSKAMEHELWTGALKPTNPHLNSISATILAGGTDQPLQLAIALLGNALSACAHGGRGTIHAPTFIVDSWMYESGGSYFEPVGNRLITRNRGDIVVSGTGYDGTGPGGIAPPPGMSWVYATGPVQYRLDDIVVYPDEMKEATAYRTNQVEYRAERQALINFDPCSHFAVLSRGCC